MLTMKDVVREGHPTLEARAEEVEIPLSSETKETLKQMMEFLVNSQNEEMIEKYDLRPGVGLAAPQINISKRMIAIYTTDEKNETLYKLLLVNPQIIRSSIKQTYIPGGEGCLSVDREVEGLVPRHKDITVRSYLYKPEDDSLKKIELRVSGFVSVVIQHEIDHLNGILFPTKVVDSLPNAEPVEFIIEEEKEENGGEL
ncbi:MAG: peptide deformylase [Candidatus Izemoplasmataceae bacterium]